MRIPKKTKILIMPADGQNSKELLVSRRLLVMLLSAFAGLAITIIVCLSTYSAILIQAQKAADLKKELLLAQEQILRVEEINIELENMRIMQEKLLSMLGVDHKSVAKIDAAGVVMTPPPSCWPIDGIVTQEFSVGDKPNGIKQHLGIDLTAPVGTPVVSSGKGIVQQAGYDDFLGNFVEIHHGFGYVTVYGHCQKLTVRSADQVESGQMIGTLGGTGSVTAPHLHFEVWVDGEAANPRDIIKTDVNNSQNTTGGAKNVQ